MKIFKKNETNELKRAIRQVKGMATQYDAFDMLVSRTVYNWLAKNLEAVVREVHEIDSRVCCVVAVSEAAYESHERAR